MKKKILTLLLAGCLSMLACAKPTEAELTPAEEVVLCKERADLAATATTMQLDGGDEQAFKSTMKNTLGSKNYSSAEKSMHAAFNVATQYTNTVVNNWEKFSNEQKAQIKKVLPDTVRETEFNMCIMKNF